MWRKTNSIVRWLGGVLLGLLLAPGSRVDAGSAAGLHWPKPLEIFQGGLAEIEMSDKALTSVEGQIGKTPVYFFRNGAASFVGLIGADIDAKPGVFELVLIATTTGGLQKQHKVPVTIKAKAFRTESFNVPPNFDQLSPETLEEIGRERADFARAFSLSTPERLWKAPFFRPVPQAASASSFGMRRIINGVARAPHSGTDLSAPFGTEVVASNHGRVALVGNYFFSGGSIVLDHGGGLFTMYFHLSKFKVEEGSLVKRGELIGLSGASGRVTGPHLHWGARLAGARIDPLELLKRISGNGSIP